MLICTQNENRTEIRMRNQNTNAIVRIPQAVQIKTSDICNYNRKWKIHYDFAINRWMESRDGAMDESQQLNQPDDCNRERKCCFRQRQVCRLLSFASFLHDLYTNTCVACCFVLYKICKRKSDAPKSKKKTTWNGGKKIKSHRTMYIGYKTHTNGLAVSLSLSDCATTAMK